MSYDKSKMIFRDKIVVKDQASYMFDKIVSLYIFQNGMIGVNYQKEKTVFIFMKNNNLFIADYGYHCEINIAVDIARELLNEYKKEEENGK